MCASGFAAKAASVGNTSVRFMCAVAVATGKIACAWGVIADMWTSPALETLIHAAAGWAFDQRHFVRGAIPTHRRTILGGAVQPVRALERAAACAGTGVCHATAEPAPRPASCVPGVRATYPICARYKYHSHSSCRLTVQGAPSM
eukprot:6194620-Pleurochrysis_carterae.AAC.2